MNTAFQVVVITDRQADNGQHEVWPYAARTRTEDEAHALAKERMAPGWTVIVTPGFLYPSAVIEEHQIAEDEIVRITAIAAD
jgi:hypothetical protein